MATTHLDQVDANGVVTRSAKQYGEDSSGNAAPIGVTGKAANVDASPYLKAITLSDATVYDPPLTGIVVGTTAGIVKVLSNGVEVTIPAACLPLGQVLPGSFTKVFTTTTTAVGVFGWHR